MTAFVVRPEEDTEVRGIVKEATGIAELAQTMDLRSQQDAAWASAVLNEIARHLKAAEARRVFFVKPLNDHVRTINDFFKGLVSPLQDADKTIRQKLLAWRQAEQRRLEEERHKALEEQERLRRAAEAAAAAHGEPEPQKAAVPVPLPPSQPASVIATPMGKTGVRRVWTFELLDLAQVPAPYLAVNSAAVMEAIRKGTREIPGLRIYEKETVVVGGR